MIRELLDQDINIDSDLKRQGRIPNAQNGPAWAHLSSSWSIQFPRNSRIKTYYLGSLRVRALLLDVPIEPRGHLFQEHVFC